MSARADSTFAGLPAGARQVALPAALLHQAVPQMDDPAELLVTLYAVAAVQRLRRFPRLLDVAALRAERPLVDALARFFPHADTDEAFRRGLEAAVARGTLLRADARPAPGAAGPPDVAEVLTLNSESDQRALDRWRRGQLAAAGHVPAGAVGVAPQPGPQPAPGINVYALYEDTIGPITPQIAPPPSPRPRASTRPPGSRTPSARRPSSTSAAGATSSASWSAGTKRGGRMTMRRLSDVLAGVPRRSSTTSSRR